MVAGFAATPLDPAEARLLRIEIEEFHAAYCAALDEDRIADWPDFFTADAIYGSGLRRGFANTEHLPGYTQVNLGVLQNLAPLGFPKTEARLSLLNAFDKTYQLRDGSGIGVGAPQFGPRRALYGGVTFRF